MSGVLQEREDLENCAAQRLSAHHPEAGKRHWKTLLILLGYGTLACLALRLAWLPYTETIGRFLYEDFFYYLQVARQIVEGHGATFDGLAPTNGFHPLWMVMCVLAYGLTGPVGAIYSMLTLAAFLHLAQAYLLFGILRRHAGRAIAHAAAVFWLVNYRAIACNLCGLETPLQALFFLLVARVVLRQRGVLSTHQALRWGGLLGLAVCARFDLGLLVASVLIYVVANKRFGASVQERLRKSLLAALGALTVLLPWLIFSVSHSGVLLPNSRRALRLLSQTQFDGGAGLSANLEILLGRVFHASTWLGDTANLLGMSPSVPPTYSNFGGLSIGLLLIALAIYTWMSRREVLGPARLLLLCYAIAHLAYYCLFVRAEARYLLPFSLSLLLLSGCFASAWLKRGVGRPRLVLSACLVLALSNVAVSGRAAWQRHWGATRTHEGHDSLYRMAHWLRQNVPQDAVIGAYAAGILGYFSERRVVNLDGVVNDDVLGAIESQEVFDYIEQRGIEYLADDEGQIAINMNRFSGRENWADQFEEIAREGSVVVLRRRHVP